MGLGVCQNRTSQTSSKPCSGVAAARIVPGVIPLCFDETFQLPWKQEKPPNPGTDRTGPEIPCFIVSQDNSGGKGPQKVSSATSCPKQGERWGQTKLCRTLPIRVLQAFKDGDVTAFWATDSSAGPGRASCLVFGTMV